MKMARFFTPSLLILLLLRLSNVIFLLAMALVNTSMHSSVRVLLGKSRTEMLLSLSMPPITS